ncbi:MAG: hypothetical protein EBV19_10710, partial [Flavobacteriia bacterium]|nr:hypothetical protein [Flavobacteriia bacterium]
MESFFDYRNDKIERLEQINLDDLYEKKKAHDQAKLYTFNKILNRIHSKIKLTSRQHIDQQFCWFVVPEIILGVAHYDHMGCVEYVVEHLTKNGFRVQYTHPNLLLISWKAYIPTYVRDEFKKKTGIEIDESGDPVPNDDADEGEASKNPFSKNGNGSGSGSRGGNNSSSAVGGMKANMNTLLYKNGKNANPALAEVAVKKKEYTPINSYKPTGKFIYNDSFFQH